MRGSDQTCYVYTFYLQSKYLSKQYNTLNIIENLYKKEFMICFQHNHSNANDDT